MLKPLVQALLEKAEHYEWSLQGFGMLRLRLANGMRLHVWDDRFRVPGVSDIHDHPWGFVSTVIAGRLTNTRYVLRPNPADGELFHCATIRCGENACLVTSPVLVGLGKSALEVVPAGMGYVQQWTDIHLTTPERGTVTIIERGFRADTEHARVFWPAGAKWVDAKPRPATREEVLAITTNSLLTWFK